MPNQPTADETVLVDLSLIVPVELPVEIVERIEAGEIDADEMFVLSLAPEYLGVKATLHDAPDFEVSRVPEKQDLDGEGEQHKPRLTIVPDEPDDN